MAPWTFNIKFTYATQFTFGSLMFVVGEDGNLELLTQGPAPKRAGVWTSSISSSPLIYIRRCLLRSESLCRVIPSHHQDHIGNPD
jgi:hypothetical protein